MSAPLPPIYRDCRRLLLHTEEVVRRFSRYHKYTVGTDLRQQAFAVMRGVHLAVYDRPQQARHVQALVWRVDEYKLTLQLAIDVGAFVHGKAGPQRATSPGFAAFETAALLAAQIGKQCGGWQKACLGGGRPASQATAEQSAAKSAGAPRAQVDTAAVAAGVAGSQRQATQPGARAASPASLSERAAPAPDTAAPRPWRGGGPAEATP